MSITTRTASFSTTVHALVVGNAGRLGLSPEGNHKEKCRAHARMTSAEHVKKNYGFDGYDCGLSQKGVPCESGIPKKILKSMDKTAARFES